MDGSRIVVSGQGYLPKSTNMLESIAGVAMRYKYDCRKDQEVLYQDSSSAARYDFTIHKGSTADLDLEYKDCDKIPMNLTGYTGRFKASCSLGHSFTMNVSVSCCLEGMINLHMSPYETSRIWTASDRFDKPEHYSYQLDLVSPSKEVYRILEGMVDVVPSAGCRS